ncbi:MAG: M20 family metallopeptidase [Bacillota bacterium]|nr:M20 family metallopeptidase [Bacillota bacterium]
METKAYFQDRQEEIVTLLKEAAAVETPSDDPHALQAFAQWWAGLLRGIRGVEVETSLHEGFPLVRGFLPSPRGGSPVLWLAHFDTVWPHGTLSRMPLRSEGDRLHGPGVFDMKGGLVQGLFALRYLAELGQEHPPVVFLCTSDEETGSHHSRQAIEKEASQSRAVLVLEPPLGEEGALKTWRKGVGDYRIRVKGRAAHAGGEPEKGRSAIRELARLILEVESWTDLEAGVTVNVGVIQGGTRPNVVPEEAEADVDVRVMDQPQARMIDERMQALAPSGEGLLVQVRGGMNRPPMEKQHTQGLFRVAREVGETMGLNLQAKGTGGGSDGNFTAALGIPTLDGLGAVGDGAHAQHEHVLMSRLPERAALLAALTERLSRFP